MQIECLRKSNGIPIISRDDIENIATKILKEFAPSNLEYAMPFKTTSFLEDYHGLTIKNKYIGTFESGILGLTVMGDEERIPTFDDMFHPVIETEYYGTVYISPSLMGRENLPRRRYTEVHEGCHKSLHQDYFDKLATTSTNPKELFVACRKVELYNPEKRTDHDWMEWQADSLAAALLMPRDVFYTLARSEIRKAGVPCGYLVKGQQRDKRVFYEIVGEIADRFCVSHKATQIRMAHLGLIKTNPWY